MENKQIPIGNGETAEFLATLGCPNCNSLSNGFILTNKGVGCVCADCHLIIKHLTPAGLQEEIDNYYCADCGKHGSHIH